MSCHSSSKQFWFKRLVLTEGELRRRYPMADKERLAIALAAPGGDLVDYAAIRQQVRTNHLYTTKSSAAGAMSAAGTIYGTDKYYSTQDDTIKMYETFEWHRPFDDSYCVMVGGSSVPIFKGGAMPNPFDFKEAPFIEAAYLKIPGEFEGYGLPMILESPQIMLNLIKNQRLDATTLSIHKMWIVNPLANINKDELVTRPFGIIYSIDPNGVREIQFSDIKVSAYKEEELLKSDMQYASGVDDFSMGVGGGSNSATEVRHLRESTLERVRMFVNHLGEAYGDVFRYWMDMTRQLFSDKMRIRIIGEDGKEAFPLIEKDDLHGYFDYRSRVLPSMAGQDDVKKKQDMDLYQLLINLPFIDPQKLTSKVLTDFGWSLDGLTAQQGQAGSPNAAGLPSTPQDPNAMLAAMMGGGGQPPTGGMSPQGMPPMSPPGISPQGGQDGLGGGGFHDGTGGGGFRRPVTASALRGVTRHLRAAHELYGAEMDPFSELSSPINLLKGNLMPPTARGIPIDNKVPNIAGHNRGIGGKINTNISLGKKTSVESNLVNRALNIQR